MEPQPSLKIDPLELSELMQILTKKTFSVYKVTWLDFVNFAQITVDNPPKESDFYGFFTKKRDSGFCGNSIKCVYSHLNKFYFHLYKEKLTVNTFINIKIS